MSPLSNRQRATAAKRGVSSKGRQTPLRADPRLHRSGHKMPARPSRTVCRPPYHLCLDRAGPPLLRRFDLCWRGSGAPQAQVVFRLDGGRIATALREAGGCSIIGSVLAAVPQPLCWSFGVHFIKHAARLRCSCLRSTRRCARQPSSLELNHGFDSPGVGSLVIPNGSVAVDSSRSLSGFCFIDLYHVYLSCAHN